jgi:hypothetical protein
MARLDHPEMYGRLTARRFLIALGTFFGVAIAHGVLRWHPLMVLWAVAGGLFLASAYRMFAKPLEWPTVADSRAMWIWLHGRGGLYAWGMDPDGKLARLLIAACTAALGIFCLVLAGEAALDWAGVIDTMPIYDGV